MLHPRNILLLAGFILLLLGGVFAWRSAHPPLTNREQLAANVEAIRVAVEDRNARTIASYLARDFEWGGAKRSELQNQMVGAFLQWRDVTANVTGLEITLEGDSAVTTGKYSLALRPHPRGRAESHLGVFKLRWKKQDGNWVIAKMEGTEDIP